MAQLNASKNNQPDREFLLTDKDFRAIVRLVHQNSGIALSDHKRELVYSRLARRLRALGMRKFSDYLQMLNGDQGPAELGHFINAITTNLTSFFRESHHFDHLRDQVLAPIADRGRSPGRFMIWSAGCSTGEEPYSIAMTVASTLPNWASIPVRMLATDLDTNALARCRAGVYQAEAVAKVPAVSRRDHATDKGDGTVAMSAELRRMIAFKQLNLRGRWPMRQRYDVIFCRNVMIYFDDAFKREILNGFHSLLKPHGTLYIGHSESASKLHDGFRLVGRTIYERLP